MSKIVSKFLQARLDYQAKIGRRVTLEEVARSCGISKQALSNIERGEAFPSYQTLARLCEFYDVQPGDVLIYTSLV